MTAAGLAAAYEALQAGGLLAIAGSRPVANLTRRSPARGFRGGGIHRSGRAGGEEIAVAAHLAGAKRQSCGLIFAGVHGCFSPPMIRLTALHLVPIVLAAAAHAGELTVEAQPFTIETSFSATALPDKGGVLLQLDPKAWADFQILELAEHGRKVAKGDLLVRFDAEAIDKKLVDVRRALETNTLTQAQAELDLKNLQETAPNSLDALLRDRGNRQGGKQLFQQDPAQGHRGSRRPGTRAQETNALQPAGRTPAARPKCMRPTTSPRTPRKSSSPARRTRWPPPSSPCAWKPSITSAPSRSSCRARPSPSPTTSATPPSICARPKQDIPRSIALKKIELETLKTAHQRR